MAILSERVYFYKNNTLRPLSSWSLNKATYAASSGITVQPGGSAWVSLDASYNDGLKVSKYRRLTLSISDDSINSTYNYGDVVAGYLSTSYEDEYVGTGRDYQVIPFTLYNSKNYDTYKKIERTILMPNVELKNGLFTVKNNSDHTIRIIGAELFRSKDVLGQVEEEIGEGGGGGPSPYPPWVPPSGTYVADYISSVDPTDARFVTWRTENLVNLKPGEEAPFYKTESSSVQLGSVYCYVATQADGTTILVNEWSIDSNSFGSLFLNNSPVNVVVYCRLPDNTKQKIDLWAVVNTPQRTYGATAVYITSNPEGTSTVQVNMQWNKIFNTGILNGHAVNIRNTLQKLNVRAQNNFWNIGDNSLKILDGSGNVVLDLICVAVDAT